MDNRFRDDNGRMVPVQVVIQSLQTGLLRELAALLAISSFVGAIVTGADWWVNG